MSCNGCRVLRKGCSESCILRSCLQWIESPEAQGHATVFVAKFFGRAGLMSFISAVPESQRPVLFQSLLFEACGRTVNPVNGAVGLMWTGSWQICQAAVETVLRGGTLRPMLELMEGGSSPEASDEGEVSCHDMWKTPNNNNNLSRFSSSRSKRKKAEETAAVGSMQQIDLDLRLTPRMPLTAATKAAPAWRRPQSPSMNSEESGTTTTTCFESGAIAELFHFL